MAKKKQASKPNRKEPSKRSKNALDSDTDTEENGHFLKFSKKQTRGWKKIDSSHLTYIRDVIDSSTKMVKSKPRLANDPTVNDILEPFCVRLKAKLANLKVPGSKYGDLKQTQSLVTKLSEEEATLVSQELELEMAIRQEERRIEELEDLEMTQRGEDLPQLCVKIPGNVLQLPKMCYLLDP